MPRVVVIKAWETRDYRYMREENYGFGLQATADLEPEEGASNERVLEVVNQLFTEVIDPGLKQQIATFASRCPTFRIARKSVRPQIARSYAMMLADDDPDHISRD